MKKYTAAIAGIALLSAAAASFAVLRGRKPPDFVYSEPSSALVSTAEASVADESRTEKLPTAEAAVSSENNEEETQEALPSVSVMESPKLRMDITFDGFDIIIGGKCEDNYISSACLISDGAEEIAAYEGENFSIALTGRYTENDYDTVYICSSDGNIFDYRVRVTPYGFEPIDTAEIAENNLRLAENPVPLPIEGVLQYITPDGDTARAREVMKQITEISDKICDGITDDYDKALAISQWIAENIYYDFDASHSSVTTETLSLSHILEVHRTVCGGYSNLFSALCAAQGIEVRNLRGEAINSSLSSYAETDSGEMHEWNYAMLDGRGVWVDVGWSTFNYYLNGKYSYGGTQLKYFDISNTALSYDHRARTCQIRDYHAATE